MENKEILEQLNQIETVEVQLIHPTGQQYSNLTIKFKTIKDALKGHKLLLELLGQGPYAKTQESKKPDSGYHKNYEDDDSEDDDNDRPSRSSNKNRSSSRRSNGNDDYKNGPASNKQYEIAEENDIELPEGATWQEASDILNDAGIFKKKSSYGNNNRRGRMSR